MIQHIPYKIASFSESGTDRNMRAWLPYAIGYCMNISTTVDVVMEREVYEEIQEDFRRGRRF